MNVLKAKVTDKMILDGILRLYPETFDCYNCFPTNDDAGKVSFVKSIKC